MLGSSTTSDSASRKQVHDRISAWESRANPASGEKNDAPKAERRGGAYGHTVNTTPTPSSSTPPALQAAPSPSPSPRNYVAQPLSSLPSQSAISQPTSHSLSSSSSSSLRSAESEPTSSNVSGTRKLWHKVCDGTTELRRKASDKFLDLADQCNPEGRITTDRLRSDLTAKRAEQDALTAERRGAASSSSSSSSGSYVAQPLSSFAQPQQSPVSSSASSVCAHAAESNPIALMRLADQQLKDACKRKDPDLALQTRELYARAGQLSTDPKQAILCTFLSHRCTDIYDLIRHGILVRDRDWKKLCYEDINELLMLDMPKAMPYHYTYQYFVETYTLVLQLDTAVESLLRQGQLSEALELILAESGRLENMGRYCNQQYSYLAAAMVVPNGDLRGIHAVIDRLRAEVPRMRARDLSVALKLLNDALRLEVAVKLIEKGYKIDDSSTFLNHHVPPKSVSRYVSAGSIIPTVYLYNQLRTSDPQGSLGSTAMILNENGHAWKIAGERYLPGASSKMQPSSSCQPAQNIPSTSSSSSSSSSIHSNCSPSPMPPPLAPSSSSVSPSSGSDTEALMRQADRQLEEACRYKDAEGALKAEELFIRAGELSRGMYPKQAMMCKLWSMCCIDVHDLITHGLSATDFKNKILRKEIDLFLEGDLPKKPLRAHSYETLVKTYPLVLKLNTEVEYLLSRGHLQAALDYIRVTGEYYYVEWNDKMFCYCQQQHAHLVLSIALLTRNSKEFDRAKIELYQAKEHLRSADLDAASQILREAQRIQVASQIVAKGYDIPDVSTFLNNGVPPESISPIVAAFHRTYREARAPLPKDINSDIIKFASGWRENYHKSLGDPPNLNCVMTEKGLADFAEYMQSKR